MKKILKMMILPVIVIVLMALYSFAGNRHKAQKLADINISFTDYSDPLISEVNVNKLLIQKEDSVDNLYVEKLDLNKSELRLVENPMIRTAEVSVDLNGRLNVLVQQRTPIARIMGKKDQYLDSDNQMMPLSIEHSVLVPIVSGFKSEFQSQLFEFLNYVRGDELLKTMITQIAFDKKGNTTVMLRSNDMRLELGKLEKFEMKMSNFKAMLAKVEKEKTIDQIETMDLRFDHQVIVVKK